jgi:ABC-type transporter Mla MlaB component
VISGDSAAMPLSITLTIRSAGVVALILRGPVGRTNVLAFHEAFTAAVRAHRPHEIELDFSGVLDVDPQAAAVVTTVVREACRDGTIVTVVRASAPVGQQIRLAGGEHLLR